MAVPLAGAGELGGSRRRGPRVGLLQPAEVAARGELLRRPCPGSGRCVEVDTKWTRGPRAARPPRGSGGRPSSGRPRAGGTSPTDRQAADGGRLRSSCAWCGSPRSRRRRRSGRRARARQRRARSADTAGVRAVWALDVVMRPSELICCNAVCPTPNGGNCSPMASNNAGAHSASHGCQTLRTHAILRYSDASPPSGPGRRRKSSAQPSRATRLEPGGDRRANPGRLGIGHPHCYRNRSDP